MSAKPYSLASRAATTTRPDFSMILGSVARHDHPQLVGPLQSDFGLIHEDERMILAAEALVGFHSCECNRVGSRQAVTRGFQDVDRFRFQRWRRLGRNGL